MVLGAIECALWDLRGKRECLPVHVLLGGAVHHHLPIYASGGVPTFSISQLVDHVREAVDLGYNGFKMRANPVAYQPEVEAARAIAVREVLGPDRMLAVDAVQNFNLRPWTVKQALSLLDALQPADLAWAEEFLPPFDPTHYVGLRDRARTHISGGEGITKSTVFAQWIKAGAFDIAQPDPTIIGGITEARKAAEFATLHDVPVAMHVWGSGPTMMANYHLGFTLAGCFTLERPLMNNPLETETLVEQLQIENGNLLPPTAVGLGIQLTDKVKNKYPYKPGSASVFG